MSNIQRKIIDCAMDLLELFDMCEDDELIEDVVNAVYYNDAQALRYLEEKMRDRL